MLVKLLALFAVTSSVALAGINCEGSSNCAGSLGTLQGVLSEVQALNPSASFGDGQHISCDQNLCAFFQSGASGTASQAAGDIQALIGHGCKKCGSVPVNGGELTVNWVASP